MRTIKKGGKRNEVFRTINCHFGNPLVDRINCLYFILNRKGFILIMNYIVAFSMFLMSNNPNAVFHGVNLPDWNTSAYERAKCISEEKCTWSHDGWQNHIRSHVEYKMWAGENLARNFENWEQVIEAWNKSEKHKEVLDKPACFYGAAKYKNVYVLHVGC